VLGEIAMALTLRSLFIKSMRKASPGITEEHASAAYDAFHSDAKRMVLRYYRAADPKRLRGWDERLLKATEKIPKLVLWGDVDPFIRASTGDRFGGTVHHFADAGHWPWIDHPEEVANLIASHVASAVGS
jgi:haloalkane dehalogenase